MLRLPFILLLNLFGAARFAIASLGAAVLSVFRKKKRRYVKLGIEGGLPFGHPRGFARFLKSEATFLDLRQDIKTLAADEHVAGVLLEPGKTQVGLARTADVVDQLDTLRDAGKHLVAHADLYHTRDYLEATAADAILLSPAGRFYSFSPRFEQLFLAEVFERHGVSAQFVHIGAYKAAASRYVRTQSSEPERRMLEDLRAGITETITSRVADRRRLTPDGAQRLFDAPIDSRTAQSAGLLDGESFKGDVERWLEQPDEHAHQAEHADPEGREPSDVEVIGFDDYDDGRLKPFRWRPLLKRPRVIAIVDLTGIIVQAGMNLPGGAAVVDPTTVIPVLKALASNRRVAAVVLHINSPGGSALGSDLIWNAVAQLRAKKPVVAYCSDVAASGGYYIAVGADRIVCRAQTITGSIGVVAGKFAIRGALEKFGVHVHSVDGDDGSEFGSMFAPLEERTLDHLKHDARSFYRRFLQRVGQARGLEPRQLHRWARGRVYLGEEAMHRNLVDSVGGFEAAISLAKTLVAEDGDPLPDRVPLQHFSHTSKSLKDVLRRSAFEATGTTAVLEPLALAQMFRHEPLLALLPWRFEL